MEVLSAITVNFTFVLVLSFLIERLLEILKAGYDLVDCTGNWHAFWTRRAERMKQRLESKIGVFEYVDPASSVAVLRRFSEVLLNAEGAYPGTVPVISGDMIRSLWVKIGSKIIGIGLGILLAWGLDINLLQYWSLGYDKTSVDWIGQLLSRDWVKYLFTGVAIGLGSGPLHKLIVALENKQKKKQEEKS